MQEEQKQEETKSTETTTAKQDERAMETGERAVKKSNRRGTGVTDAELDSVESGTPQ